MEEIIKISDVLERKKKEKEKKEAIARKKQLDISASYASIEECLKYLDIGNLEETKEIRGQMKISLKLLAKVGLGIN